MLEFECHLLDIKIACEIGMKNQTINQEDFDKFVEVQSKIKECELKVEDLHNKIELVRSAIDNHIINEPEKEEEIKSVYEPRIELLHVKLTEKVSELNLKKFEFKK